MQSLFLKLPLLCLTILLLGSCEQKEFEHYEIHVFVDKTESDIQVDIPRTTAFIKDLTGLESKEVFFSSVTIHFSVINEYRNNPVYTLRLQPGNILEDKAKQRIVEQEQFLVSVAEQIKKLQNAEAGMASSMVVQPVCDKLNNIQTNQDTKTVLLVFSDMVQNDNTHSFFKDQDSTLQTFISTSCVSSNLINTDLYCIYEPNSKDKDALFQRAKNTFTKALQNTGAQIYFKSNI